MMTNGLGHTDLARINVVGGITLELFDMVGQAYGLTTPVLHFAPHIAQAVFIDLLQKYGVDF
jgi:hypothetical protein